MFLCPPCHQATPCRNFMEFPSRGRCESCGQTANCVDCHYTDANIEAMVEEVMRGATTRYFITSDDGEEQEVTKEKFVAIERAAGFHNTMGHPNEPATAGFSGRAHGHEIKGRTETTWPEEKTDVG